MNTVDKLSGCLELTVDKATNPTIIETSHYKVGIAGRDTQTILWECCFVRETWEGFLEEVTLELQWEGWAVQGGGLARTSLVEETFNAKFLSPWVWINHLHLTVSKILVRSFALAVWCWAWLSCCSCQQNIDDDFDSLPWWRWEPPSNSRFWLHLGDLRVYAECLDLFIILLVFFSRQAFDTALSLKCRADPGLSAWFPGKQLVELPALCLWNQHPPWGRGFFTALLLIPSSAASIPSLPDFLEEI